MARINEQKNKYPFSYEYEAKVEQIEGTANYIELKSLKILNRALYQRKLEKLKSSLLDVNQLPL